MSEKHHVARSSAIAGGSLALLKLVIGILSGSLALTSEGIHSSLDFFVTLFTWFSVKTADIPADREHPYGHGKIENLSAFAQSLLLFATALWITIEAYHHLTQAGPTELAKKGPSEGGWYAAVAVISIALLVDFNRARVLAKAARKFNSQALEADAIHFGTELLAAGVVLIGLLLVKFGGPPFWIADPIAAIAVAGVMVFTAVRLGRRSADILIDRAPEGLEDRIHDLIRGVAGVQDVVRVRARQGGPVTFVDATVTVDPSIDLAAGHRISDNVELRVTEKFPNLDIIVHVEPARAPTDDHLAIIRATAEAMHIRLHAIRVRSIDGHLYINFHAEFSPDMTLASAHQLVTDLEERIHKAIPRIAEIDSHMEPVGTRE